ncbi:helix-turn-helix transcriptional regulator [Sorangium sp. So ce119]|uniref:AraC family transcriptional regulator n=1 Tax=Sorangium sp. So ce119 TaxID=3133279 RepID=UPI003F5E2D15
MSARPALFQPFPMLAGRRAQVFRHQPQYRRPRHFHEEPEINLVARGAGIMAVGERVVPVVAGTLLYFAPGQDHALLEESMDFVLYVAALRPELAARIGGAASKVALDAVQLTPAVRAEELALLGALDRARDTSVVEHRLAELFERSLSNVPLPHVVSRRIFELLRRDPSLPGAALAARLHTGESGISRRFRKDVGVNVVEYRARLKLMQFVAEVDRGASFARAAYAVGFGSYAQCHRVFTRALGCAPQAYFGGQRAALTEMTLPMLG